jgi:D-alanyl-D-alanine carboxypeptidase
MRALAALGLIACAAPARPTSHPRIDELAAAALHDGGAVGLSIAVLRGERVVHARGYGLADVAHCIAATEQSVYPLASLSKQYWAVAFAQLTAERRAAADEPVAHFPDRRLTVRHLLTQTSGLGDDRPDEDDATFSDAPALAFPPGTWWRYSNRGALVVRRIVERVTGQTWDAQLHARIAQPLGLAATTTCTADNHVALYDAAHAPWSFPASEWQRLAFVCASALDVARFERGLDTGTLLARDAVQRMRAPTALPGGIVVPYGWFTRIAELDGHIAYGHTGNLPGASVAAYRFPADDLTIVVLMNAAPKPGFRAWELLAAVARDELGLREPAIVDRPVPADELTAVAGSYAGGPLRAAISARGDRAWLTVQVEDKPLFDGALVWLGGRDFAGGPEGVHVDSFARFLPATGKATAIAVGHRFLLDQLFRMVP